ncbi:MAG: class I tRNA ligase family protein, partial [bacterium]
SVTPGLITFAFGLIKVIGLDGRMTEEAGLEYAGLKINEAREKFVSWLKEQGLYIKEEEVDNNVGTSDRFGDIVESLPMDQWFIDVNKKIPGRGKSLKELMQAVVTSGHNNDKNKIIAIKPERYHESYLHWIENLRDWCISRQIWWGHRIPVWYCDDCKEIFFNDSANPTCPRCQSIKTHQDEDTLDTWFSSGLWTFSTLGWPDDTQDMKDFHPTDWMQMGYEILFFWMARMILMTTYVLDDIPFKEVFIHGILRDKNGKKFSKSLGNGIDPLDVVAKYGTDALRFCLLKSAGNGNDAKFYEEKVESARNFVNKFWNISRFIFQAVEDVKFVEKEPEAKTFADRWILTELKKTINAVDQSLDKHEFSYACDQLYDFTWDYFADWYLEISKVEKNKDEILLYVLQNLIRLWHPMMPFITEELWKYFATGKMLMISSWPETQSTTGDAVKLNKEVDLFVEVIKAIRNLRSENKIEPAKMVNAVIYAKDNARFISEQLPIIQKLARLDQVEIKEAGEKPEQSIGAMVGGVEIFILLAGLIDVEAEKKRLTKELEQTDELVSRLSVKLSNGEFVNNAPVAIVEKEKAKLAEQQEKLNKLKEQLASLK